MQKLNTNLVLFILNKDPEMEFKEFEPRFKSAKTRFKLSAGLNLETFDTILSNFKWNQPYLSRGLNLNRRSNSLNSAKGFIITNLINLFILNKDRGFIITNLINLSILNRDQGFK